MLYETAEKGNQRNRHNYQKRKFALRSFERKRQKRLDAVEINKGALEVPVIPVEKDEENKALAKTASSSACSSRSAVDAHVIHIHRLWHKVLRGNLKRKFAHLLDDG